MTNRAKVIRLLGLLTLVLAGISSAQTRPPIMEQVAKTYGLDSWSQVEAIRYTFTVQFPGVNLSRSWIWEPKTGQVTYESKDKSGKPVKVTYKRDQLSSQPANVKDDIDPGFINDNYWLLFPFHAQWDTSATVTDEGMKKMPGGKGSAELVAVKYPSEGGYTPVIPGNSTSARTTAWSNLCTGAAERRSRASSSQAGQAIRRQVPC